MRFYSCCLLDLFEVSWCVVQSKKKKHILKRDYLKVPRLLGSLFSFISFLV